MVSDSPSLHAAEQAVAAAERLGCPQARGLMPRRRGLRPRLFAALLRSRRPFGVRR